MGANNEYYTQPDGTGPSTGEMNGTGCNMEEANNEKFQLAPSLVLLYFYPSCTARHPGEMRLTFLGHTSVLSNVLVVIRDCFYNFIYPSLPLGRCPEDLWLKSLVAGCIMRHFHLVAKPVTLCLSLHIVGTV